MRAHARTIFERWLDTVVIPLARDAATARP